MEESCLLCLEMLKNKEFKDCIKSDSTSWQEQNVKEIIEKHFWPLNDVQLSSIWLCLACWQEVKDFNEFYVRIEKAHQSAGKLKTIKQELQNFGYLEPEILITSPDKMVIKTELSLDEPNLDIPVKHLGSSQKLIEDPLEKSVHSTDIKENKEDMEEEKNVDTNLESNSDSEMDDIKNDGDYLEDGPPKRRRRTNTKRGKHCRDNELFIKKHFKQMVCDLCELQLGDFPDMQKHFLDVHKQNGYLMCCSRKFYHRNRLVDHIYIHLNPEHFKCDQCGKVLSNRAQLRSHTLSVHRPKDVELKHNCDICGKSFAKSNVLRNHKLTHLPKEEKKFPCSDCGKHYASSHLLKLHREVVHLNKFAKMCYICGLTFRTNTEYKSHMNKHEGITTNINCDICGLRISSERGLKQHKESQHPVGGKQEHKCTICPKVSPTLRALKKHFNEMHVKGYEHKCSLCEKSFKRTEGLKEHMASHTGTALYTCPWCPKTFNSNGNMHAHRKKIHPKESEEAKLKKYFEKESLHEENYSN